MTIGFQINDFGKGLNDIDRLKLTFRLVHPILPFEHDIAIYPRDIFHIKRHRFDREI